MRSSLAGAILLCATLLAAGRARACAFPDGYVRPVHMAIVGGARSVRAGQPVTLLRIIDSCGCVSFAGDPSSVTMSVAPAPDGPWRVASVTRRGRTIRWRASAPGIVYARFEAPGRENQRMVFAVRPRGLDRRSVELPAGVWTARYGRPLATLVPAELEGREDGWELPVVPLRWTAAGRRADGPLLPGRYRLHAGRRAFRHYECWRSARKPRVLEVMRYGHPLGALEVDASSARFVPTAGSEAHRENAGTEGGT